MGRKNSNREYYKKEIERMKDIRKEYGDGEEWKDYPTTLFLGLNKDLLMKHAGSYEEVMFKSRVLVDRNTFSKYVNGEQAPNAEALIRLAKYANCYIDDLVITDYREEDADETFRKPALLITKEGVITGLANKNGKPIFFDARKYVKTPHVEGIKLDFDSPVLYTRRGTILICDYDPDECRVQSDEDGDIYALMIGKKIDFVNPQDPAKQVFKDTQTFYITKIKKVKNEYGVQGVRQNVFSYLDEKGELQFQTITWINEHMKSRILSMINYFDY